MITAGIDVGFINTKAVILKDGKLCGKAVGPSGGIGRPDAVKAVYDKAVEAAGINSADVSKVIATGKGKFDVPFSDDMLSEVVTAARAAGVLVPGATAVVGIGADETLVATLEGETIKEFVINQKCAAGLGLLLENMAERFGISIEEMSALEGVCEAAVSDGCAVFAELDALSLVNRGTCPKEVMKALIEACAWRASSTINDIYKPTNECVVLIGGLACNEAFVRALERISGIKFVTPKDAMYAAAIGAAALAGTE